MRIQVEVVLRRLDLIVDGWAGRGGDDGRVRHSIMRHAGAEVGPAAHFLAAEDKYSGLTCAHLGEEIVRLPYLDGPRGALVVAGQHRRVVARVLHPPLHRLLFLVVELEALQLVQGLPHVRTSVTGVLNAARGTAVVRHVLGSRRVVVGLRLIPVQSEPLPAVETCQGFLLAGRGDALASDLILDLHHELLESFTVRTLQLLQ